MHSVQTIKSTASLHLHIKNKGVLPGKSKLTLLQKALALRTPPRLGSQGAAPCGDNNCELLAYVRVLDPGGGRSWYVLEWDRKSSIWVYQVEDDKVEFTTLDLTELAWDPGSFQTGLEVDVNFRPTKVGKLSLA